jgi:hypothetical protein
MRAIPFIILIAILTYGTIIADQFPGVELHAPDSDIIFAHDNHTDMDCADCHDRIELSDLAGDRNLPTMDVCGECHDTEDTEECGICHRNADDPTSSMHPERTIVFGHKNHLSREVECSSCHGQIASSTKTSPEHMPSMSQCFSCHDGKQAGDQCELCHGDHLTLADIHPVDWRHQHGDKAVLDEKWCTQCHHHDDSCIECHRGDNLTGKIHDLNYIYTHGLDAKSKRLDCSRCHDNQSFCYACHERENRIPLLHSSIAWLSDHGRVARRDVESCASCHDSDDPTCGRSGCHRDDDGLRGTDPRYHSPDINLFSSKGPWHNDDGYYCYHCHSNTNRSETGFCGYCHGFKDE